MAERPDVNETDTMPPPPPPTMRAITYHRYGGPEVLAVEEVDRPALEPGRILVRVQAAEACKSDCEMRGFDFSVKWFWLPLRLALGVRRPRRTILGLYFAGVVEEVGESVTRFVPGDEVYGSTGMRRGAYGEYVSLPDDAVLARKPTTMTFAEAAAVPLGAINALHFLRAADVGAGDRVLVNAAGGVIGAHGVQLAAARGAHVTGVDAGHKEEFVRRMGAAEFVDYRSEDVTETTRRFDMIFDMVPTTSVRRMLRLLRPRGRYANGNPRLSTLLRAPFVSRLTDKRMHVAFAEETSEVLEELAAMAETGELVPIVDRVLPMADAAQAHRLVESEERIGAIVLEMGPRAMQR